MKINKITPDYPDFPDVLRDLSLPVNQLYVTGESLQDILQRPVVTVVGSRKVTAYGQTVTRSLVMDLAAQGVVIVSGLALGVDAIAHRAALDAGGTTVAVLPGSVEQVYPRSNATLAAHILKQGGALVSEYAQGTSVMAHNFVHRNRIASALCDVLLVTEASEKSGTLHTAKYAVEQGKTVMAVPGNITSELSSGTNGLIKRGALVATCAQDVIAQFKTKCTTTSTGIFTKPRGDNAQEQTIIDLISGGMTDGNELFAASKLPAIEFNHHMTMLEISGKIRQLANNQWGL